MRIDWDRTEVELRNAGRVRCEPGWTLEPSWSSKLPDYDLWFICEGSGSMRLHDREVELRPGVCLWMRPGGRYEARQNLHDRMTVGYAHFELMTKTGKVRDRNKPLPPEVLTVMNISMVDAIMRRISSGAAIEYHRPGGPHSQASRAAACALFRGLLMDLDADSAALPYSERGTDLHHRQVIEQAAMRITEHPGAFHDVAALAAQAGYSPDHFTRLFKRILGISPQAHVIRVRIDRARHLLVESSLTISQIADALGYEDVFFFSRQFKAKTGQTPGQYRQAGR